MLSRVMCIKFRKIQSANLCGPAKEHCMLSISIQIFKHIPELRLLKKSKVTVRQFFDMMHLKTNDGGGM
jgi:hypothetical protein